MKGKQTFFNKTCKIAKFWTFLEFHEIWPKLRSRPMHLCGKFAKHNNNYKIVAKENKLSFIKPCKTARYWMFTELHVTWPKRWSRPMHLRGDLLSVIIITS